MPQRPLPPPPAHPDDPPFVCIQINASWIPYIIGLLRPAKFPEYWAGTLDENRNARRDVQNLIYQFQQLTGCEDDMATNNCCIELQVITRVNVTTGDIEISVDNGQTWQPKPGAPKTYITEPAPPVTTGVTANKCNAATDGMTQIEYWITHTTEAFDIAASIVEFATVVAGIILEALLVFFTEGAGAAAAGAIIEAIGLACAAVWAAGKDIFANYWTPEVKDDILCSLFCHIGENGSFTEEQYQAWRTDLYAKLPNGPAKTLFFGFMGSVGRQGLNRMCATGTVGDADCGDCTCTCDFSNWSIWNGEGTYVSKTADHFRVEAVLAHDNVYVASVRNVNINGCCCDVVGSIVGIDPQTVGVVYCGDENDNHDHMGFSYIGGAINAMTVVFNWPPENLPALPIVDFHSDAPCA